MLAHAGCSPHSWLAAELVAVCRCWWLGRRGTQQAVCVAARAVCPFVFCSLSQRVSLQGCAGIWAWEIRVWAVCGELGDAYM